MTQKFEDFVVNVLDLKKSTHLTPVWREKTAEEKALIRQLFLNSLPTAAEAAAGQTARARTLGL